MNILLNCKKNCLNLIIFKFLILLWNRLNEKAKVWYRGKELLFDLTEILFNHNTKITCKFSRLDHCGRQFPHSSPHLASVNLTNSHLLHQKFLLRQCQDPQVLAHQFAASRIQMLQRVYNALGLVHKASGCSCIARHFQESQVQLKPEMESGVTSRDRLHQLLELLIITKLFNLGSCVANPLEDWVEVGLVATVGTNTILGWIVFVGFRETIKISTTGALQGGKMAAKLCWIGTPDEK